jgi:hypothetical protein
MAKKDEAKKDDGTSTVEVPKIVKMKRVLHAGQEGPTTADVHLDEVESWRAHGWNLSTE